MPCRSGSPHAVLGAGPVLTAVCPCAAPPVSLKSPATAPMSARTTVTTSSRRLMMDLPREQRCGTSWSPRSQVSLIVSAFGFRLSAFGVEFRFMVRRPVSSSERLAWL